MPSEVIPRNASRLTPRRSLLTRAAAVAGGAVGLGWMAPAARAAALTVADPVITLHLGVDWEGLSQTANEVPQIMGEVFAHFSVEHPGLRVAVSLGPCSNGPNNSCADCDMSATLAGLMAGKGLDVFSVCGNEAGLIDGGLVQPLLPLLARDNVPLSTWPANTVATYMFGGQLYFLPSEEQPYVLAYNRAILDQLGLPEPRSDWTYEEAARIWRTASGTVGGRHRYGLMDDALMAYGLGRGWTWIFAGFGGAPQASDYTRSTFNTAPNLRAAEWAVQLAQDKALTSGDLYGNLPSFTSGQSVFIAVPSWGIPNAATALRGMDWSFIPYPVFPAGRSAPNDGNPYALSGTTRYPEAAWELLKWVCVEPTYWRYEVRLSLNTPSQTALWPEYTTAALTIAPDLANKGLQYFAEVQTQGYGHPAHPYRYADGQAENIVGEWSGKMWAGQVTPAAAFSQIDQQVNALEKSAALTSSTALSEAAVVGRELSAVQAGHVAAFTRPTAGGIGAPSAPAATSVTVAHGVVTVAGSGAGLGGANDDGTFACAASTAADATFVCRLTGAVNVDESPMDPSASFGLMLRADLSDDAPMAAVLLSAGQGITQEARGVDLVNASHWTSGQPSALFRKLTAAKGANFLSAPVWLKVERRLDVFSTFTSPDGVRWTPAGPPSVVRMAGAWVGLFVTSNQPGKAVRGTFDHLQGFTPGTFVALGG